MAVLGLQQVSRIFADGSADRIALYAFRNAITGDTRDLSVDFLIVKQAVIVGSTVMDVIACSVSGTVVTMPAGLSSDAGYLLAWGGSSGSPD